MKPFKSVLLFIFFCLISCELPGPYRDIELSILNARQGIIVILNLPNEEHIYQERYDMDYKSSEPIHISNIANGKYKLRVIANDTLREMAFEYFGRESLLIEF